MRQYVAIYMYYSLSYWPYVSGLSTKNPLTHSQQSAPSITQNSNKINYNE